MLLFDLYSEQFKSKNIYIRTINSDYSFRQISHYSEIVYATYLENFSGVVTLRLSNQLNLIICIWACLRFQKTFFLLPDELNDNLAEDLIKNANSSLILQDSPYGNDCKFNLNCISKSTRGYSKNMINQQGIYFLTSGTTTLSKLVWVDFNQFAYSLNAIRLHKFMPYVEKKNVLISSAFYHSYGFSSLLEYTLGGSTIFISEKHSSFEIIKFISDEKIMRLLSAIEGVPYFYQQLIIISHKINLVNLEHVGIGGDLVPDILFEGLVNCFNFASLSIRYGVTELPSIISLSVFPPATIQRESQVLPIYNVTCKENENHPDGGEIIVRYKPFFNISKKTLTGDLGKLKNGRLIILGRNGNFVKYKGNKISLVALEELMLRSGMVKEARCSIHEEKLEAEIVPINNDFSIKHFKEYISSQIPWQLVPEKFELSDTITRTMSGKISRNIANDLNNHSR